MKKFFTIFTTLALLCAVGCEEQGDDNVNPNDKPNTEQPGEKPEDQIPDDAYLTITMEVITFSPDGESVDVKVYSNYEWTLTNNCDWVTTSVTGGEASDAGTTVTLTADLTYDDREGTITFSCGKAKKLLVVSQSFKEAIIADENNVFNVPAEGGNVIINYQATVECEVIIPWEAKSWISLAPATRALVSESATLNIAENNTCAERSAVVKVVKVDDNTLFAEYTINQVQNDAIIADENNVFNVTAEGGNVTINYQTNVECEVVIPEEAQSWISLAPATRALVDESATLNIAENNTGAERSAVVKVVAANNNELVAEYTITQNQRYFMEYTSQDGSTVTPYNSYGFGATIIRNEYINGKGYIEFDAPITSIGYEAFQNCTSLESITIPDSVTRIGDSAFSGCFSLTSVTIPDSVTSIGEEAFYDCYLLERVDITDIVAWCGISFGHDSSSTPLSYAHNLYLNGVLVTELIIPDGVTSIGNFAFWQCLSLTSITIPDSVTSIGDYTFYGCNKLTSVTIPDSVISIGEEAFYYCLSLERVDITDIVAWCKISFVGDFSNPLYYAHNLYLNGELVTDLVIPDGVTSIGEEAFFNCDSLTSVTIGNSVTKIGDYAFEDCDSLTSVTIGNGVTSIGDYAFSYCDSLTSVTIPDSVTEIGDWVFRFSDSLTDTYVNITDLAAYAKGNLTYLFRGAKHLMINGTEITELVIPFKEVETIGDSAFEDCTSLTSITIPETVFEIGGSAFRDCTSLTSVYCKPTTPPSGNSGMFSNNASGRKIYVPTESVDAYKEADGWKDYADYIVSDISL